MKTSETTRPTLSSLPVGKRAEEGTPHNLFTVIGLDDSPSPYLSPSVKALIDQGLYLIHIGRCRREIECEIREAAGRKDEKNHYDLRAEYDPKENDSKDSTE